MTAYEFASQLRDQIQHTDLFEEVYYADSATRPDVARDDKAEFVISVGRGGGLPQFRITVEEVV